MTSHEELAQLFARNFTLSQPAPQPAEPAPVHQTSPPEQAITYSITQHYHHSGHLVSPPPRPTSTPTTDAATISIILSRHGVDAGTLLPSQLSLFTTASPSQQMRLVELWRISPPSAGGHAGDIARNFGSGGWSETTFEREEELAQLRYETAMMEERAARAHSQEMDMGDDMMSDSEASTNNAPLTPILGGDSRFNSMQINPHYSSSTEPYITSGYEALAAREYENSAKKDVYSHFGTAVGGPSYRALDPVYKTVEDVHKYPNVGTYVLNDESRTRMEDQYGAVHGFRGLGNYEDEEML